MAQGETSDRYQILTEHPKAHMVIEDTGLGLEPSQKLVVVQVTTRRRKKKQKKTFYRLLCQELEHECGIPPSDVMVTMWRIVTKTGCSAWVARKRSPSLAPGRPIQKFCSFHASFRASEVEAARASLKLIPEWCHPKVLVGRCVVICWSTNLDLK
jgi:hypothetical protein